MGKKTDFAGSPLSAGAILRDIEQTTIVINGETISRREGEIRLLYAKALKGHVGASTELQSIRDRTGADRLPKPAGCLVVPEPISLGEWERRAAAQQAPYRSKSYGIDEV